MIDNAQRDLSRYYVEANPSNDLGEVCGRNSAQIAEAARAIRIFAHGKPPTIRHAAITAVYYLIRIGRGRSTPQLRAALAEKLEIMGGK